MFYSNTLFLYSLHLFFFRLFERDVRCIQEFFRKRFKYESEDYPKFEDIVKKVDLDSAIYCSGYTKKQERELNEEIFIDKEFVEDAGIEDDEGNNSDNSDEFEVSGSEESEEESEEILTENTKHNEFIIINKDSLAKLTKAKLNIDDNNKDNNKDGSEVNKNDINLDGTKIEDKIVQKFNNIQNLHAQNLKEENVNLENVKEQNVNVQNVNYTENKEFESNESTDRFNVNERLQSFCDSEDRFESRSMRSVSTSKPREEIRRIVSMESRKREIKQQLRQAGRNAKTGAVHKNRQDNKAIVKEYKGWV